MNNTLLFTYSTDIMVRLLTEICKTFLLQKSKNVQPHYSQNSHENATPSSGTCPLASYKEVPPQPLRIIGPLQVGIHTLQNRKRCTGKDEALTSLS